MAESPWTCIKCKNVNVGPCCLKCGVEAPPTLELTFEQMLLTAGVYDGDRELVVGAAHRLAKRAREILGSTDLCSCGHPRHDGKFCTVKIHDLDGPLDDGLPCNCGFPMPAEPR